MESNFTAGNNPITRWLRSSPLGSGSFGHVSLALNLDNGSLFAVKSLRLSSPVPSSSQLLAMQNELRILHSLHSPHIIPCLGAQLSPSSFNLFLEYMDGGSLAHLIKRSGGKLDESHAGFYTREILQGLNYLHHIGIVHCDIKGQNILIGSSGVKIADFGAAKRLGDLDKESSCAGQLKGTPLWMAPEVVQGKEQDCAADIWSLGCTVLEMLQGRPAWGHITSTAAALYKIGCSDENPPLPGFISEEAKDFLHHCLQRDPNVRWTAADLLQHPFVCGRCSCERSYSEQPSPRSALECVDSDWENELSDVDSLLPILSCRFSDVSEKNGEQAGAGANYSSQSVTSEWVTVKRVDGWSTSKRGEITPFVSMAWKSGDSVRKRGSEVSLDAATFILRNRKSVG